MNKDSIPNGGPAAPCTEAHGTNYGWSGMSLRDHFAGLAMQGLLTTRHPDYAGEEGFTVLSADAYMVADAMLAAREQS